MLTNFSQAASRSSFTAQMVDIPQPKNAGFCAGRAPRQAQRRAPHLLTVCLSIAVAIAVTVAYGNQAIRNFTILPAGEEPSFS